MSAFLSASFDPHADANKSYNGPHVLPECSGMVRSLTSFCVTPKFFETMKQVGRDSKLLVVKFQRRCFFPSEEKAFIAHSVEDSAVGCSPFSITLSI